MTLGKVPSGHRTRKATTLMEKRKRAKERKKQRTSGGGALAADAADASVAAAASSQEDNAGHGCWEGVWYNRRGEMHAPPQETNTQEEWEPQYQADPMPRAWQPTSEWERYPTRDTPRWEADAGDDYWYSWTPTEWHEHAWWERPQAEASWPRGNQATRMDTWWQAGQWSRGSYYKRPAPFAVIAQLHLHILLARAHRHRCSVCLTSGLWLESAFCRFIPCAMITYPTLHREFHYAIVMLHCQPGQVHPALEPPLRPCHRSPVPPTRPIEACSSLMQHLHTTEAPAFIGLSSVSSRSGKCLASLDPMDYRLHCMASDLSQCWHVSVTDLVTRRTSTTGHTDAVLALRPSPKAAAGHPSLDYRNRLLLHSQYHGQGPTHEGRPHPPTGMALLLWINQLVVHDVVPPLRPISYRLGSAYTARSTDRHPFDPWAACSSNFRSGTYRCCACRPNALAKLRQPANAASTEFHRQCTCIVTRCPCCHAICSCSRPCSSVTSSVSIGLCAHCSLSTSKQHADAVQPGAAVAACSYRPARSRHSTYSEPRQCHQSGDCCGPDVSTSWARPTWQARCVPCSKIGAKAVNARAMSRGSMLRWKLHARSMQSYATRSKMPCSSSGSNAKQPQQPPSLFHLDPCHRQAQASILWQLCQQLQQQWEPPLRPRLQWELLCRQPRATSPVQQKPQHPAPAKTNRTRKHSRQSSKRGSAAIPG